MLLHPPPAGSDPLRTNMPRSDLKQRLPRKKATLGSSAAILAQGLLFKAKGPWFRAVRYRLLKTPPIVFMCMGAASGCKLVGLVMISVIEPNSRTNTSTLQGVESLDTWDFAIMGYLAGPVAGSL